MSIILCLVIGLVFSDARAGEEDLTFENAQIRADYAIKQLRSLQSEWKRLVIEAEEVNDLLSLAKKRYEKTKEAALLVDTKKKDLVLKIKKAEQLVEKQENILREIYKKNVK